jgi:hypothetical protein
VFQRILKGALDGVRAYLLDHPEVQFDARRLYEESARGVQRCIPWTATYTPPPYDATNPAHQPLPPLPSREELYALALAHTHAVRTGQEKD